MRSVRALRVLRRPAAGAVAGQVGQALSGLVLQVVAARSLGAEGFAVFAVAYGAVVLATAFSSGLVGDSLTVLDRTGPGIRAGLHVWALLGAAGAGSVVVLVAAVSGQVGTAAAVLLGAATAAFLLEDILRRLLMAAGRFWSLPAVDLTALGLALATLAAAAASGELTLASFALALLVGQAGAALVAVGCLPPSERPSGPLRPAALRAVLSFGAWRAAAQMIRPALLTVLRVLVVALAGAAAWAPVEAARVYTAPTLVLVGGLGSYLLPRFVQLRDRPAAGLRSADRTALLLAASVAGLGGAALAALPWAGGMVTGGSFPVPAAAVAGWSVYAVASAVLLPYAGMAAAHHRQRPLLAARGLELVSLAVVLLVVLADPASAVWTPFALAIGPLLAAAVVRGLVLRPRTRPAAVRRPLPVAG